MTTLKLVLFVGISVGMMLDDASVLARDIGYSVSHINEDYEENAILFDEPATTTTIPDDIVYDDMLDDIVYDEDSNEDSEENAVLFDEPAKTIPDILDSLRKMSNFFKTEHEVMKAVKAALAKKETEPEDKN